MQHLFTPVELFFVLFCRPSVSRLDSPISPGAGCGWMGKRSIHSLDPAPATPHGERGHCTPRGPVEKSLVLDAPLARRLVKGVDWRPLCGDPRTLPAKELRHEGDLQTRVGSARGPGEW